MALPVYTPNGGDWVTGLPEFSVATLGVRLDGAMQEQGFDPLLIACIAIVRSDSRQAKKEKLSIGDLNEDGWDQVDLLIKQQWRIFPGYICRIELQIFGKLLPPPPKRPATELESPTASPARRRTRTVQLEEQSAQRRDINESPGYWVEKLVDRWICNSDQYINEDQFGVDDYTGKHYMLTSAQQNAWANAIPTGRQAADIEHPPADMYDYLRNKQGPVTNRSKNPVLAVQKQEEDDRKATLSAFDKIMELIAKREELRIIRDFGSEREVLTAPIHLITLCINSLLHPGRYHINTLWLLSHNINKRYQPLLRYNLSQSHRARPHSPKRQIPKLRSPGPRYTIAPARSLPKKKTIRSWPTSFIGRSASSILGPISSASWPPHTKRLFRRCGRSKT